MKPELNAAQRSLIHALAAKKGATYNSIITSTGLPRSVVVEECQAAGLVRHKGPVSGSENGRAAYTREELVQVIASGKSLASFARSRGVSRQAVCAAAKRWGLCQIDN